MRCADRLCSHLLRGRAQGPAKVIQSRRGQRFRRVSFRPGGGPPLLERFAALRPSLRVASVAALYCIFFFRVKLHPALFFFRPAAFLRRCTPSPSRLRGRMAFPVALCGPFPWRLGLHIRPPTLPPGGFWGRRGPVRVQAWPEAFRACSAGAGRFFARVCPDRSAGASGGASACAKVAEAKSRPRQPFSRSAGLNYSRSSSADNSAIFLRIDSFFCAATKSLNAFAANSHL